MKRFLGLLAAAWLLALAGTAVAQPAAYPARPIRIIVPYPPGGGSDAVARLVGQKLTEAWGQSVVIENRGGGNTIIGTEAVVTAPADGYTILLAASSLAVLPYLRTLPYDTLKDLAPVATVSTAPQVLMVPSALAGNLQELIALAKSKPDQLNYASVGNGTGPHLAGELFNQMHGVRMKHIPYKGSGPAITDLLAGRVQIYFIGPTNVLSHVKNGKLNALAVSGTSRVRVLPEVPTFAEAGLPGFDIETWYGIFAPAGTPKPIVDKLSAEIGKFLNTPDGREKLEGQGMRPFINTADQFTALLHAEMAKYGKLIKDANIKGD